MIKTIYVSEREREWERKRIREKAFKPGGDVMYME